MSDIMRHSSRPDSEGPTTKRVVVPDDPTPEMHAAGMTAFTDRLAGGNDVFGRMVDKAPAYKPSEAEVEAAAQAIDPDAFGDSVRMYSHSRMRRQKTARNKAR